MKLKGQVVLITGGAEGIGAACVHEMAARGAHISILDLQQSVEPVPQGVLFTLGDVTDHRDRELFVERSLAHFGSIDILLNNAGVGLYETVQTSSLNLPRRLFDINLFAPLALAQLVIPVLSAKRSGAIVNIASIAAGVALPWAPMYCASKAAIQCLSESMRRELGRYGVRVITVTPAVVDTQFRSHVLAGVPPMRVAAMRGIPPARLARAICQKLEGRGSWVIEPWYGRVFALANQIAPWFIDWYIENRWHEQIEVPPAENPPAEKTIRERLPR